jgi:aspartate aminotransferase
MVSERILKMIPSATVEINKTVSRLKAEGKDIIGLNVGEPDFDTPGFITEAAVKAMKEGKTRYTEVDGIFPLREAIAKKLKADNGVSYSPNDIIVSVGAKQAINNAVLAICNPGDEVIIPRPCWVSYVEIVKLADAVPVLAGTDPESFQLDMGAIEKALSPKTRAVLINTPNNPTGAVYSEESLRRLGELAVKNNFYIISDEVYEKLIYDGEKHICVASMSQQIWDRTITINGFSKAYAMTGWRIGYSASPSEIASSIRSLQGHTTSSITTFVQWAAVAALEGSPGFIDDMCRAFSERRAYVVGRLRAMSGIKCADAKGAFYLMPDVSSYFGKTAPGGLKITNSVDFCKYLLEESLVSVVPGVSFEAPDNVRVSYSNSMENLKKSMDRIEAALSKLA